MDAILEAKKLFDSGHSKIKALLPDGNQITLRLFKSVNGSICYKGKGRKNWGTELYYLHPVAVCPIISRKTIQKKWEDAWNKVKIRLLVSGLWSDIVSEIDVALGMGYDKINQAYQDYWNTPNDRQVQEFKYKYPELIKVNDNGEEYINTSGLWNYAKLPKVKKMYINAYNNEIVLQRIQLAMDNKVDHREDGRVSYDVSFSYKAALKKAWYAAEFKGCGNGHYFIALDATHCLFMEDD